MSLLDIQKGLRGDSRTEYARARSSVWELSEKALGIEHVIFDFAQENGSEGRFLFVYWLASTKLWKINYSSVVLKSFSDFDLLVRATAIGLVVRRGRNAFDSIFKLFLSENAVETEADGEILMERYLKADHKYENDWVQNLVVKKRQARALKISKLIIDGMTVEETRGEILGEDSFVFDHLKCFLRVE
ncbi:MAG: hypothetical protein KDE03_17260 [Rhodobacteraceae bacterium]|nr:hypothetical protein [Paracoccaceae bacterium]